MKSNLFLHSLDMGIIMLRADILLCIEKEGHNYV